MAESKPMIKITELFLGSMMRSLCVTPAVYPKPTVQWFINNIKVSFINISLINKKQCIMQRNIGHGRLYHITCFHVLSQAYLRLSYVKGEGLPHMVLAPGRG